MREHPELPDPQVGGQPRIGIVGAGRTRQGLGPFLAHWTEQAGAILVGVSGKGLSRTQKVAAELSDRLGHSVAPYASALELAEQVDALIVACPVNGHLAGLDAALASGIPCLCEKPLVPAAQADLGLKRIEGFRDAALVLAENCQWPFVLSALEQLQPGWCRQPVRSVEMRLSPSEPGRVMVEDSLSHVLSLLQAVVRLAEGSRVESVKQSNSSPDAEQNTVQFEVLGDHGKVAICLHLERCADQPRPAWFAINGFRLDRQLGQDYSFSFVGEDGSRAIVQDPLALLVYDFIQNLQANHRERTDALDTLALRLRLYADVLRSL